MRKHVFGRKLNRTTNERKQLRRNLVRAVARHGSIVTTLGRAKMLQPYLEKLITIAKKSNLNSLRSLLAETGDLETSRQLSEYGKLFKNRPGGYTRLVRLGFNSGDNSPKVQISWVEQLVVAEVVKPTVNPVAKVATVTPKTEEKVKVLPKTKKKKGKVKTTKTVKSKSKKTV